MGPERSVTEGERKVCFLNAEVKKNLGVVSCEVRSKYDRSSGQAVICRV